MKPNAARQTKSLVLLFCVLAAAHVFVFSAAFPFFSVTDEQAHFDLVTRYAQAAPPRALPHTSETALPYIVWFSSPEYLWTIESGKILTPPWTVDKTNALIRLAPREKFWRETVVNHEAAQPPIYYSLAGAWWHVGQWLRLTDGDLLLWLRLLNMVCLVTLVWLGAIAAQKIFPENNFIQIAVPAFIAIFPQSVFYAINNDILSPIVFGAAFLLLLTFWEAKMPTAKIAAATGLALAATFLTKISNAPLLIVAVIFLALKFFGFLKNGKLRAAIFPFSILTLCAALPVAAWMAWCKMNFGDLTGTAQKIQFLGWTDQPPTLWLSHPIFTAHGFWYFLKTNLATFWFGEQLWHRTPLVNDDANSVVVIFSLGMCALALAALLWPRSGFTSSQRTAVAFSLACLVAAFLFFAWLSVKYDFQDCFYPSREKPFFVSGRLMLGMLIPFLILFCAGLDRLMKNFQATTKFFVLFVLLGFLLASEIATDWPVFASQYNWFHQ